MKTGVSESSAWVTDHPAGRPPANLADDDVVPDKSGKSGTGHSSNVLLNRSSCPPGRSREVQEIDPVGVGIEILHRVQEPAELPAAIIRFGAAGSR